MEVRIRLFALQRQQVGWRDRPLEVPDGATIGDAWQRLVAEFPVLEASSGVVRFARNARYADASEPLAEGDEVAVIPPVAGGAGASVAAGPRPSAGAPTQRRFFSNADIRDVIQLRPVVEAHAACRLDRVTAWARSGKRAGGAGGAGEGRRRRVSSWITSRRRAL